MKNSAMKRLHPMTVLLMLISALTATMFTQHPAVCVLSLCSGMLLYAVLSTRSAFLKSLPLPLVMIISMAVTNPIFSHRGKTVLFLFFGASYTLESLLYGFVNGIMLAASLYWCMCLVKVLDRERIMYLFSRRAPKIALVLSMTFRFVPKYIRDASDIADARRAMGCFSSDSLAASARSGGEILYATVTRALEGSLDTGLSMKARGYGSAQRSFARRFRFKAADAICIVLYAVFTAAFCFASAGGAYRYSFYPAMQTVGGRDALYLIPALCILLLPFVIELKELLRWKFLRSRI